MHELQERATVQRWPSARAMTAIRSKIREATSRRYVGRSVDGVADDLSMIMRGWGNYFRYGNSAAKFAASDSYAQERMAIFTSAKHGRSGRNWDGRYTYAWYRRLGVHRLSGTVVWV
ncbi:MAG: group II intron maturase-specific domain-containing protein [Frankiaceae bacterium]